jgi:hypothetical protein
MKPETRRMWERIVRAISINRSVPESMFRDLTEDEVAQIESGKYSQRELFVALVDKIDAENKLKELAS